MGGLQWLEERGNTPGSQLRINSNNVLGTEGQTEGSHY